MMNGRIKINAKLYPRPFFEIRYIKSRFQGSFPIIGLGFDYHGVYACLHPFYFSVHISRKLKPPSLTEEEKEILRKDDL